LEGLPLYYWRKAIEDRRVAVPAVEAPPQFA
jgi:hypothetical protein